MPQQGRLDLWKKPEYPLWHTLSRGRSMQFLLLRLFYTKLALNTATQSREALKEQSDIFSQGSLLT